jgi:transcription factor SPN1
MGSQFALASRPADSQNGAAVPLRSRLDAERERALAPVVKANRAQPAGLPASYTVAPRSTFDATRAGQPDHRPIGAGGLEAFRRMTQKGKGGRRG